jgi:glycosyltransferase involved in cell wall biosynthesis
MAAGSYALSRWRASDTVAPSFSEFVAMRRLRMLQLFNRYEAFGGEEAVVQRITASIAPWCDVTNFQTSTEEFLNVSPLGRARLPFRVLRNGDVVRELERRQSEGGYDLWQAHNILPVMSPAAYTTAFRLGVPVVQYLHSYRLSCANGFFLNHGERCQQCIGGDFWPAFRTACWRDSHTISGWMGLVLWRLRELGVFEKVTRWIAISEAVKAEHVRMGIPAERIDVVHHFHEPAGEPPPPATKRMALFVGRISVEKGVRQLLAAWKLLNRPDCELVIAGDGSERASLEAQVQRERLGNVRFTGFISREEQSQLWQQASFSVVPSIWLEPFGLVVLEAWAQARAVVAHRLGALPELIEHGKTGRLADANSAQSLANEMAAAFDHPDETEAMGRAGRERLGREFTRARWEEQLRGVYRRVGLPEGVAL